MKVDSPDFIEKNWEISVKRKGFVEKGRLVSKNLTFDFPNNIINILYNKQLKGGLTYGLY